MKRILKAIRIKTKNNKAFSLVEVLCAIVLLAIIATPILQAIMGGLNLNLKSRKLLSASDLTAGTMEFISSLVFDDYTYANGGTNYSVKGYESYYWNVPTTVTKEIYPSGPVGMVWGTSPSTNYCETAISDINYDGFKYTMIIKCTKPSSVSASDQYFTYDVTVDVYESGGSNILSSGKTCIANSYK